MRFSIPKPDDDYVPPVDWQDESDGFPESGTYGILGRATRCGPSIAGNGDEDESPDDFNGSSAPMTVVAVVTMLAAVAALALLFGLVVLVVHLR
jgi:hypothetical protein